MCLGISIPFEVSSLGKRDVSLQLWQRQAIITTYMTIGTDRNFLRIDFNRGDTYLTEYAQICYSAHNSGTEECNENNEVPSEFKRNDNLKANRVTYAGDLVDSAYYGNIDARFSSYSGSSIELSNYTVLLSNVTRNASTSYFGLGPPAGQRSNMNNISLSTLSIANTKLGFSIGREATSGKTYDGFIQQLKSEGEIDKNQVSVSFLSIYSGKLEFGDVDESKIDGEQETVSLFNADSSLGYDEAPRLAVDARSISFGNTTLSLSSDGIYLDPSLDGIVLPERIFDALNRTLGGVGGYDNLYVPCESDFRSQILKFDIGADSNLSVTLNDTFFDYGQEMEGNCYTSVERGKYAALGFPLFKHMYSTFNYDDMTFSFAQRVGATFKVFTGESTDWSSSSTTTARTTSLSSELATGLAPNLWMSVLFALCSHLF